MLAGTVEEMSEAVSGRSINQASQDIGLVNTLLFRWRESKWAVKATQRLMQRGMADWA
jgi:hypothetical protein